MLYKNKPNTKQAGTEKPREQKWPNVIPTQCYNNSYTNVIPTQGLMQVLEEERVG